MIKAKGRAKSRVQLHRRTAHRGAQAPDAGDSPVTGAQAIDDTGNAFFATAGVQADGSLREIGGTGRTWANEAEFHRERGWRAGTVMHYYPADFDKAPPGGTS